MTISDKLVGIGNNYRRKADICRLLALALAEGQRMTWNGYMGAETGVPIVARYEDEGEVILGIVNEGNVEEYIDLLVDERGIWYPPMPGELDAYYNERKRVLGEFLVLALEGGGSWSFDDTAN